MKAIVKGTDANGARELTPAEIRGVLLQLARKKISERVARPAIEALNRIMCDAFANTDPLGAAQGKHGR
ncbi:MAG TPA: hypothetical protein VGO96_00880 [Pyrinomonadaceae bacterium]|nr:hypothetical protein [Pyrinomonadaceae bacterium]